jgi:hypothetical protein
VSAPPFLQLPASREVLGELLHSLSQPLTTLRCSLELSIDEATEQQQEAVGAALEQTETVISMIQLMREYLDVELAADEPPIAVMPVLKSVTESLSSVAALRDVQLRLIGSSTVTMRAAERQLRKAFEYLIQAMVDRQTPGSTLVLLLGEGPAGAVLRVEGEGRNRPETVGSPAKLMATAAVPVVGKGAPLPTRNSLRATIRRVRLAIAARALESAGASLAFDDDACGFALRMPLASSGNV